MKPFPDPIGQMLAEHKALRAELKATRARMLTVNETASYLGLAPKTIRNGLGSRSGRPFPVKPVRVAGLRPPSVSPGVPLPITWSLTRPFATPGSPWSRIIPQSRVQENRINLRNSSSGAVPIFVLIDFMIFILVSFVLLLCFGGVILASPLL